MVGIFIFHCVTAQAENRTTSLPATPSTSPISAKVLLFLRGWVRLSSAIPARTIPLPESTAELSQLDFKISLRARKVIGPIEKLAPELTGHSNAQCVFFYRLGQRTIWDSFLRPVSKSENSPSLIIPVAGTFNERENVLRNVSSVWERCRRESGEATVFAG